MRVFTTMSLTFSDGYVEYKFLFDTFDGPSVYWYPFWDADLGTPIGKKAQLYRNREGLTSASIQWLGGLQSQWQGTADRVAGKRSRCFKWLSKVVLIPSQIWTVKST